MTDPRHAQTLLESLRHLSTAQDAIALLPTPMHDASVGSFGVDPMSATAIVDLQRDIDAKLASASDIDLLGAYREAAGETADVMDADVVTDALTAEIRRRGLSV